MNARATSVLLPLKNYHPVYLRKSLDSIIHQSAPQWHLLIVVEPGDLDLFKRLLEKELRDARVWLMVSEGRKLAGALNTGMRHARTEFVGILLSDDMWSTQAVQVLNDYQSRFPEVDFFHSSRMVVDENDHPLSSVYFSRTSFTSKDFLEGSPVKHLLCWRREKALSLGGMDESLNSVGSDDYDFPWCMAEKGAVFMAIKECLYLYRDHRECYRLTTHLPRSVHRAEIARILEKHGAERAEVRTAVRNASRSFLRQCLYGSRLDQWVKEKLGYDARRGWRMKYR
jgi:glycosyltransferase involved in cell wall biosynthesis